MDEFYENTQNEPAVADSQNESAPLEEKTEEPALNDEPKAEPQPETVKEQTAPQETGEQTQNAEQPQESEPQNNGESEKRQVYNAYSGFSKVEFSPVKPVKDYKPMSKGLRVFSLIMAAVILMTASCAAGYFFGQNKNSSTVGKKISVSLSSKPKKTDEMTAAEVYEKINKSVVGITVYNKQGTTAQASGVIYSKDGYIVTNDHIYSEIPAPMFKIYDYKGKEYDAEFVAGDSISDLSLLKVKGAESFAVADFGNSDELIFGESVVAVGRPSDATADSSITKGIISHTKRRMQTTSNYTARLIQTDSAINPGSSGGALVNMFGQVIGITSSKLAGVNYDSMGFAIPTTTMKRVVTELSESGKVKSRAKLGITYQAVTSIAVELGQYERAGLLVASVSDDSDLKGKVEKDDIIIKVNGKDITNSNVMLDVIDESSAGDKITVTVFKKGGKTADYTVTLKANVGESSYSLNQKGFSEKESPDFAIPDGDGDGTFNFPKGE